MKIRTYNGAMGFGFDYYLATDSLTVVARNDFGHKPKEVLRSIFEPTDKARWSRILAAFPLEKLAMTYSRANVDDGLQMWFDFRIPGRPKKPPLQAKLDGPSHFAAHRR